MPPQERMNDAQRAYEAKRAAKAGKSLDAWLTDKRRRLTESTKTAAPPPEPKKRGFIARLLDRAHKPL